MNGFPTFHKFHLVNLDDTILTAPVVGFVACGGSRALPLVVGGRQTLITGDGLLDLGSGDVLDLTTGVVHPSLEEWRDPERTLTYRPGLSHDALRYPDHVVQQAPTPGPNYEAPKPRQPLAPPADLPHVAFSPKSFARQSFWQAPEKDPTVLFIVEPEKATPLSGALKIKRDDYDILKKTLPEVTTAMLASVPSPEEPELPLGDESGDDDGTDMI